MQSLALPLAFFVALPASNLGAVIEPDGSELIGNYVQVAFGNSKNRIFVYRNNMAVIKADNGVMSYANWSRQPGKLCLQLANGRSECWPYATQFQPGQTVKLVSDCGAPSSWTLRLLTQ